MSEVLKMNGNNIEGVDGMQKSNVEGEIFDAMYPLLL